MNQNPRNQGREKMLKSMFKCLTEFFKAMITGDDETANSIDFADMSEEENDEDMKIFGDKEQKNQCGL